jgi:hypothetical protein
MQTTTEDLSSSPLDNPSIQAQPELSFANRFRLYAHRLPAVLRSALGHLCLRFPKGSSCGPTFELDKSQLLVLNKRTLARFEGIQALSSNFPWVDGADCHIFLIGFDAGERWALCRSDNGKPVSVCQDQLSESP